MKCKKLSIETDGTTAGTKIFVDGEQVGFIQNIELEANVDQPAVRIQMQKVRMSKDGKPVPRTLKVRDEKTQKFIDKQTFEVDPLVLEFEAFCIK